MRDGIKNQKRNPEVPVDLLRSSSLLNEQVFALKALTNLLKNAYQGLDVEWDMEEVFHGGESSGVGPIVSSGDGSGGDDDEDSGTASVTAVDAPAQTSTASTTTAAAAAATTAPPPNVVRTLDGGGVGSPGTDASGGHKAAARPSLQKALVTYLLPVVAVWFGGSFLEWIL